MKNIITILFLFTAAILISADNNTTIAEIISDINNYKNTTLVINLRLKYLDRVFDKIVFYDSENIDIEFDISGKAKRKELAGDLVNIHEGMQYRVKFTVVGAGSLGGLTGDLHEFTPVIIDKIPLE